MSSRWLPRLAWVALSLSMVAGCRPAKPIAPDHGTTAAPATGSDWVGAAAATAQAEAPGPPVELVHATDVDGEYDHLIEGTRVRAEYGETDPWLGAAEPSVTIVAFYDYQCPYSKRLMPRLDELAEAFPDDVRVVFKQFPLAMHNNAELAARLAIGAQHVGRFWAMHHRLFVNQGALDRRSLLAYGQSLGLDVVALEAALDDPAVAKRVTADFDYGTRLGVSGTPAMFFNGRLVSGARELSELRQEVEAELVLVDKLQRAGAPRHTLYAHFMHAASAGQANDANPTRTNVRTLTEGERHKINTKGLPQRGPDDAPVKIVVCSDFDCPFCQRVVPTIDALLDNHPQDVAFFFRHLPLPFHKGAEPAARAAIAAQAQGKFWEMHDLLFADREARSEADLTRLAKKAGLNTKKFRKVFRAKATAERVRSESAACSEEGIRGTPGFLINGRRLSGARPLADFETVVAEELEFAR